MACSCTKRWCILKIHNHYINYNFKRLIKFLTKKLEVILIKKYILSNIFFYVFIALFLYEIQSIRLYINIYLYNLIKSYIFSVCVISLTFIINHFLLNKVEFYKYVWPFTSEQHGISHFSTEQGYKNGLCLNHLNNTCNFQEMVIL